jgi:mannosyl-oligosaccharide alpha-1,2-mannosidase
MALDHGVRRRSLLGATAAGSAALATVGGGLIGTAPAIASEAGVAEPAGQAPPGGWRAAADDVRNELLHAWRAYERLAWGHDELMPVSGGASEFFDADHPVGLTIVEALDTLFLMGLDAEVTKGVAWIRDNLDFRAVDEPVQIFETNIRMVGGLLSGYLATGEAVLLSKAKEIADILLPAFERSPTGAPYRFVNPSTGELSGVENFLAEIGTIITEFGTLSRLVRDDRYYLAAKKAMQAVYDRRSPLDLVGTTLNVETGAWVNNTASIHPPVDSYFEYLWDGWDLFRDRDLRAWYGVLTRAIIANEAVWLRREGRGRAHLWFARINMDTGQLVTLNQSELGSFYAGLLGQSGYLRLGDEYLRSWASLLDRYPVLPGVDPLSGVATVRANALRPEYVDSAFNLWLVTGHERYRHIAYDYYVRQKTHSRVPNGWTVIDDVTTTPVTHGDLTSGYWWSEQMKYWYLMFANTDRFNYRNNYLSTEGNVFRGLRRR